jgi:hypothetical protein
MNKLKVACLTVIQFVKQVWSIPQMITDARWRKRRQQVVLQEYELDRLDRLRNPSKYQGK